MAKPSGKRPTRDEVKRAHYASLRITTARTVARRAFELEIDRILSKGHEEYGETASVIYGVLGTGAPAEAIIEKGLRYGRKGKPEDLVKAAAYAFLEWERTRGGA